MASFLRAFRRTAQNTPVLFSIRNVVVQQQSRGVALRKRFYRNVAITQNNNLFEIILDQRKVKTPNGLILQIPHEMLALAVAAEWEAQRDNIKASGMHLTTLCYAAIDKPLIDSDASHEEYVNHILRYMDSDTLLYRTEEPKALCKLQEEHWDPIVNWICERFQIKLHSTFAIDGSVVLPATRLAFKKHLLSFPSTALHGILLAVETIKSLLLTLACIDRQISVETAVKLSRLESEYQIHHWGEIEWAHGLEIQDSQARLAAAILFIHTKIFVVDTMQKKVLKL